MICYQTRYEDGVFVGTVLADRDPIDDRWAIPGAAFADAPPVFSDGKRARRVEDQWVIEDDLNHDGCTRRWDGQTLVLTALPPPPEPEPVPLPPPPVLTPAEKLASIGLTIEDLKALLA